MRKVRVLVVDDSFFMRKMVTDLLQSSGLIEVIDTGKNGLDAVGKVRELMPDVVTLDVEMPRMDGLEALQKIMEQNPVPIIMLSSLTRQGTDTTIKALQHGAFDFVAKPSGSISFDINKVKKELIDKILLASKQKEKWVKQWNRNNYHSEPSNVKAMVDEPIFQQPNGTPFTGVIAIGTSTGGPRALQDVITALPGNLPYPVLIVQHMPAGFTKSLATRLNGLAKIRVHEATNNQLLEAGNAYIAPGNYHMRLENQLGKYSITLNQEEPINGHRPSVDALFDSLENIKLFKIFVIMTGMGSDGSKALKRVKKAKDIVIAEDESSCVVFGMPKAAIQTGLVNSIKPLNLIAKEIVDSAKKQGRWQ